MVDFDLRTWDLTVRRIYKGKQIDACNWQQIPVQSVFIEHPLCVIKIENRYAAPNWRYASNVTIFAQEVKLFSKRIYLNEPTFIEIEQSSNKYGLSFWFPWWHREIALEVWQKALETDCDVCPTLERIEKKVDDIFNYSI